MVFHQPRTVFYHYPCLDGAVAAWAVHKYYGQDAQYVGLDHADHETIEQTILQNVTPETIVMFVDFAPHRQVLETIIDQVKGIEIYDHHISAQKDLALYHDHPKCKILFDMTRSGAGIAFDVFAQAKRPLFVQLVEQLDLYQPEKFSSLDQFFLIASFLGDIDVERPLEQLIPDIDTLCQAEDIAYFEKAGEVPRRQHLEKIDEVIDEIGFIDLSSLETAPELTKVPIVHADMYTLGHEFMPRLMEECPHESKVGIVWSYHENETVKFSLRSDRTVDVSLIAGEIGRECGQNGGGHVGAAAVRFSLEQFREFARVAGLYLK
jgi:oligoribonuclease NrnB/cAMP/cGMP phosphodiesterase (DHH superfamily)